MTRNTKCQYTSESSPVLETVRLLMIPSNYCIQMIRGIKYSKLIAWSTATQDFQYIMP